MRRPLACYLAATSVAWTKPFVVAGAPGGATCIQWTPSTGTLFTGNFTRQQEYAWGPRDLTVIGPNGSAGAGVIPTSCSAASPSTTNYGVILGGANGAAGFVFQNVTYKDFGVNMYIGDNTYFFNWNGGSSQTAGLNLCVPDGVANTGESMKVSGVVFSGYNTDGTAKLVLNSIYLGSGGGYPFQFDAGTSMDNVQLNNQGSYLNEYAHHEVYPNSVNQGQPMVVGAYASIYGGDYWFDDDSLTDPIPAAFINQTRDAGYIHGARFETNNATGIASGGEETSTGCLFEEGTTWLGNGNVAATLANNGSNCSRRDWDR